MCLGVLVWCCVLDFFFVKQKTAYEMRISDWSSDVCSSDLVGTGRSPKARRRCAPTRPGRSRFPNRKRGHASDEMGAAYAAGYALGKLKTAGDSCAQIGRAHV